MNPTKMTKKDFEAIAAVFVDAFENVEEDFDGGAEPGYGAAFDAVYNLAFALADVLCGTNDAFNPVLFLYSAGIDPKYAENTAAEYSPRMGLRVQGINHRSGS